MTLLVLIHILLVIVETPSPQMTSMSLGGLHVPPALRRLVLEGRAGVERALRARAFDAS
jgi:hypothetical protein